MNDIGQVTASDLEALRRGAVRFRKLAEAAGTEAKKLSVDSMKLNLQRRLREASDDLADIYVHPGRLQGSNILTGKLPALLLRHAKKNGLALFRTMLPKCDWFVALTSTVMSEVCVSVTVEDTTYFVCPLKELKESEDVWRLIL